jgi:hypothetical protein
VHRYTSAKRWIKVTAAQHSRVSFTRASMQPYLLQDSRSFALLDRSRSRSRPTSSKRRGSHLYIQSHAPVHNTRDCEPSCPIPCEHTSRVGSRDACAQRWHLHPRDNLSGTHVADYDSTGSAGQKRLDRTIRVSAGKPLSQASGICFLGSHRQAMVKAPWQQPFRQRGPSMAPSARPFSALIGRKMSRRELGGPQRRP